MATANEPRARLKPARPDSDERAAYMPRIPWRYVLIGAMSVGTLVIGYHIKERQRADLLRSQILRVHEQLEVPRTRYLELREKLEKLVHAAGKRAPETFADRRLRISGLRSGQGLYLRMPGAATKSATTIRKAASQMDGDVIASCMGLAPTSARGFFEQGEFLSDDWIKKTKTEDSVMHLRVTDEMLARRVEGDLPTVLSTLQTDWFLLVLEQGPDRSRDPVDVFLFDLKRKQRLLSGRVQARGALMPLRVKSAGAPAAPRARADDLDGSGATDCSIASQIKELAGTPAATVQHVPDPPGAAADAATSPAKGAAPTAAPGAETSRETAGEPSPR